MNQGMFEALLAEAKRTNALLEELIELLRPPVAKAAEKAAAKTTAKAKRVKPGDGVKVAKRVKVGDGVRVAK